MKLDKALIGIPDKLFVYWLGDNKYITPADEGEAVAIAAGYYLATGKKASVFMSADGFCNALNPLTSWIIPDKIEMDFYISVGRLENQHFIMSKILKDLIKLIPNDPEKMAFTLIEKKS